MTRPFERTGYPWPGDPAFSNADIEEAIRQTTRRGNVDQSIDVIGISGGEGLLSDRGSSGGCAWFRVLSNQEVDQASTDGDISPAETENLIRCRDCAATSEEEQLPSIWGQRVEIDQCGAITDAEEPIVLLRFPALAFLCGLDGCMTAGDVACDDRPLWYACYSGDSDQWYVTDDSCKGDTVDAVRFCGPRQPVQVCGAGGCWETGDPSNCCLYDGVLNRVDPSCDYICGGGNTLDDVWLICNDVASLGVSQDCWMARKVADAYTVNYCPISDEPDLVLTSTRPVYQLPCCGCGCPLDRMTLEFFADESCQLPTKVTFDLQLQPPGPDPDLKVYKGWFCLSYLIPVYIVGVQKDGIDGWVRPNCLTGEFESYYRTDTDVLGNPCAGSCFVEEDKPVGLSPADLIPSPACAALYLRTGPCTGDPQNPEENCEEVWQTCKFCYEVEVNCKNGLMTPDEGIRFKAALPPGHPHYAGGSPQSDPNMDPVENLYSYGDWNKMVSKEQPCPGREWFTMDSDFGGASDPGLDLEYGFPHLKNHLFGACCIDFCCVPTECSQNNCGCCEEGEDCAVCQDATYVKATWNCDYSEFA